MQYGGNHWVSQVNGRGTRGGGLRVKGGDLYMNEENRVQDVGLPRWQEP